jgi:hypothetical protein
MHIAARGKGCLGFIPWMSLLPVLHTVCLQLGEGKVTRQCDMCTISRLPHLAGSGLGGLPWTVSFSIRWGRLGA